MRILFLTLNYAPEQIGIGPYSAGLAEALAAAGHEVDVVCAQPYYPAWRTFDGFRGQGRRTRAEQGVRVTRCPIYVPAKPSAAKRIVHHLSFALSALGPMLSRAITRKPDLVLTVAPSLIAAPVAKLAAVLTGARSWLHIQDFEIEAAFATGLVQPGRGAQAALGFEGFVLRAFDRVSSISPKMCEKLASKRVLADRIREVRNWADDFTPHQGPSGYRAEFGIETPHVALYSGNIANKQGIEIVVEAAHLLRDRRDLTFVICGEGPNRAALVAAAEGLDNIRFEALQPRERLPELLALASVHLLPQLAGAADLVLPSKLANMLASGRPVAATADAGTGLAAEVQGCGIVTQPGDGQAFAAAIAGLLDDPARRETLGTEGRQRAEQRWSRAAIIRGFEQEALAAIAR